MSSPTDRRPRAGAAHTSSHTYAHTSAHTSARADVVPAVRQALAGVPAGSLTVRLPERLPPVAVARGPLDDLLTALVRTALGRTPPGARVLVRADAVPGRGGSDAVRVTVADRGPTVAGEAKHRLVSRLPPACGGRLTCEDNPAGGLVLVLTLPAARR
ncbi:hypothetical protein ACFXDE_08855 [Kitasatospora sp. NPDC059408]|uniref:hypothetical protein n=1 Tax=Kitasatospora sp. NPDC059408 TaxID=3346823 RepID=UPI003686488A